MPAVSCSSSSSVEKLGPSCKADGNRSGAQLGGCFFLACSCPPGGKQAAKSTLQPFFSSLFSSEARPLYLQLQPEQLESCDPPRKACEMLPSHLPAPCRHSN